jgi:hypothetical protein
MIGEPGLYFCTFCKTWDAALEALSGLSRGHHQMAPYSTSCLSYNNETLCIITMEMNRCAAKEPFICKTAGAPDGRHACPACQCNVHAICGELCEDAGPFYHITCFPCFARHKWTFESPDNFQHHCSVIAAADRQEVSAHSLTVVIQVMDGDAEDNFDDGHKAWDSVSSRTEKAN